MPYLSGVLTGIVLTILVVFLIDHVGDQPASKDIVNWDVLGAKVGAGVETVSEEVRQEVHEATAPEPGATPEPGDTAPNPEPAPAP